MDFSQFEALSAKVEHAIRVIEELKQEREALRTELHSALEARGNLEKELSQREEEFNQLREELSSKSDNIHQAGEKVRDIVNRLESVLA